MEKKEQIQKQARLDVQEELEEMERAKQEAVTDLKKKHAAVLKGKAGSGQKLAAREQLNEQLATKQRKLQRKMASQAAKQKTLQAAQAAKNKLVLAAHRAGMSKAQRQKEEQHALLLAKREEAAASKLAAVEAEHDAALEAAAQELAAKDATHVAWLA